MIPDVPRTGSCPSSASCTWLPAPGIVAARPGPSSRCSTRRARTRSTTCAAEWTPSSSRTTATRRSRRTRSSPTSPRSSRSSHARSSRSSASPSASTSFATTSRPLSARPSPRAPRSSARTCSPESSPPTRASSRGRPRAGSRYRRQLGAPVEIWADVEVKHGTALHAPGIAVAARELVPARRSRPAPRHRREHRLAAGPRPRARGPRERRRLSGLPRERRHARERRRAAPPRGRRDRRLGLQGQDGVVSNPVDPLRVTNFMNLVRSIRLGVGVPA